MTKKKLNLRNVAMIAYLVATCMMFIACKKESTDKQITSFSFATPPAIGVINEKAKSIAVQVPDGTDVTALVPTITVSEKATVSPTSGVAQNFTNSVTYTVTAENGNTQAYIVTVTKGNGSGNDKGVLINGVRWATCNVDTKGTFATKPENYGNYYTWTEAKNACPNGWRLPTKAEIESLVDKTYVTIEWTTLNDRNGMRFTDKATDKHIFIPAAGWSDGTLGGVGEYGMYWGGTEYGSGTAYDMFFFSGGAYLANSPYGYGMFIRCVSNN